LGLVYLVSKTIIDPKLGDESNAAVDLRFFTGLLDHFAEHRHGTVCVYQP